MDKLIKMGDGLLKTSTIWSNLKFFSHIKYI